MRLRQLFKGIEGQVSIVVEFRGARRIPRKVRRVSLVGLLATAKPKQGVRAQERRRRQIEKGMLKPNA